MSLLRSLSHHLYLGQHAMECDMQNSSLQIDPVHNRAISTKIAERLRRPTSANFTVQGELMRFVLSTRQNAGPGHEGGHLHAEDRLPRPPYRARRHCPRRAERQPERAQPSVVVANGRTDRSETRRRQTDTLLCPGRTTLRMAS